MKLANNKNTLQQNFMTPIKPYLIRAIYEWIVDNDLSPYINVDTLNPLVAVPTQYIVNNSITLDISPDSVNQLLINNEALTCQAMFDGKIHDLYIPTASIVTIYTEENNQGMTFPKEEFPDDTPPISSQTKSEKLKLKVIPGGKDQTKS